MDVSKGDRYHAERAIQPMVQAILVDRLCVHRWHAVVAQQRHAARVRNPFLSEQLLMGSTTLPFPVPSVRNVSMMGSRGSFTANFPELSGTA